MRHLRLFPLAMGAMLIFAGCKSQRSTLDGLSPSLLESQDGTLPLNDKESQALYELMRGKEEEAGMHLTSGALHNVDGLIQCGQATGSALAPCYLRVKLNNASELTQSTLLSPELASQMWNLVRGDQRLGAEAMVIADVQCSYIGKATPPYDVEDTKCKILYPRLPNETMVDGALAEELASKLQGDTPYEGTSAAQAGSLLCFWSEEKKDSECILRSIKSGVLQERHIPLGVGSSRNLFKILQKAAIHNVETSTLLADKDKLKEVQEYMSAISCTMDLTKLNSTSQNYAHCKLSL